jgi:hypothetical protein
VNEKIHRHSFHSNNKNHQVPIIYSRIYIHMELIIHNWLMRCVTFSHKFIINFDMDRPVTARECINRPNIHQATPGHFQTNPNIHFFSFSLDSAPPAAARQTINRLIHARCPLFKPKFYPLHRAVPARPATGSAYTGWCTPGSRFSEHKIQTRHPLYQRGRSPVALRLPSSESEKCFASSCISAVVPRSRTACHRQNSKNPQTRRVPPVFQPVETRYEHARAGLSALLGRWEWN